MTNCQQRANHIDILLGTRVAGLHFCCQQYRSILVQIFRGGLQDTSFEMDSVMAIQGHRRSLILAQMKSMYMTSYYSLTVTLVLSCTVSEIRQTYWPKSQFSQPHSHLMPLLVVNPFKFLDEPYNAKTRIPGLFIGEDFVILACIVLTQCQNVTHGQTDRLTCR